MASEQSISREEADKLVIKHRGWAESIAKSVARAWSVDWQMDGLDGAAMEALLFCARRYDPSRGVPFKGYSRRRIHEASTEAARKSKGWQSEASSISRTERLAREVSAELFNVFPDLHSGQLPMGENDADARAAIQQMLVGASIIATKQGMTASLPDEALDYKRMISVIAVLEPIHQMLIWRVYWEGISLRGVASEWETDELNVIREHKVLLAYLQKAVEKGRATQLPRVRPALQPVSSKIRRSGKATMFEQVLAS